MPSNISVQVKNVEVFFLFFHQSNKCRVGFLLLFKGVQIKIYNKYFISSQWLSLCKIVVLNLGGLINNLNNISENSR